MRPSRSFNSVNDSEKQSVAMTAAQADDDLTEGALVHVQHPAPDNPALVNAQAVAKVQVIIEHRRQEVVRGGDHVKITVKMEVDILHGRDLGVTTTRPAAFDPKTRSHGRLTQADHRLLADSAEGIGQPNAGCRFAFTRRGGIDGRNQDQLSRRGVLHAPAEIE
jgi:hypothetical protein